MTIEMIEVSIRDLSAGYEDNNEGGVKGYNGKLDIRPPYQREFVYKEKQRNAVIHTVNKHFPLNVMYWAVRENGEFEVIDGQQRTISICQYVEGEFSVKDDSGYDKYFHTLHQDARDKFLDYKLTVYLCSGTDDEKLDWFSTINIAGERLTNQELRNAVYSGSFVSDAKRYFSKTGCPAHGIGGDYLNGASIRQEYLETVIGWKANSLEHEKINNFMSLHQNDPNAKFLWEYFQLVLKWVKKNFTVYRREMKGVDWGLLYNDYKNKKLVPKDIENEVKRLMLDEDVTSKKGIYEYVLTRKEKFLNIRAFTDNQKREAFERQGGKCSFCKKEFTIDQMEADHINPWHDGGKTSSDNCQMLCKEDNRKKSGK
jgi:hypothetical protein